MRGIEAPPPHGGGVTVGFGGLVLTVCLVDELEGLVIAMEDSPAT